MTTTTRLSVSPLPSSAAIDLYFYADLALNFFTAYYEDPDLKAGEGRARGLP